jgi:hypothetical protein
MSQADQATIDLLTDYFDAIEVKDHERLGSYYADNITLTFANAPTITGRDAVLKQMTTLLGKVKSLAHPLINVWQEDGGVVILEVTSIWRLHDDTVVEIKACSIHIGRRQVRRPAHLRRQRPRRPVPRLNRAGGSDRSWLGSPLVWTGHEHQQTHRASDRRQPPASAKHRSAIHCSPRLRTSTKSSSQLEAASRTSAPGRDVRVFPGDVHESLRLVLDEIANFGAHFRETVAAGEVVPLSQPRSTRR